MAKGKVFQLRGNAARPMPPAGMLDAFSTQFAPAPEVLTWARDQFIRDTGTLHNPEHQHLIEADFEMLWTNVVYAKGGRMILGQTELVMIQGGGWKRARQELQLEEWFGRIPKFIITLDAGYCAQCSDAEFCALVEHELYHIGHKPDEFGNPGFTKEGDPKLYLRGHDVEEFVGVVRRYGVGDPGGAISLLAAAARGMPEISAASIASACGTCLQKAA